MRFCILVQSGTGGEIQKVEKKKAGKLASNLSNGFLHNLNEENAQIYTFCQAGEEGKLKTYFQLHTKIRGEPTWL